jgi:hypothetical protein
MTTNNQTNSQGPLNDGQIFIGATSGHPIAENITAGTGVTITNSANSITISAAGGGLSWSTVAGTSQAAAVNNGYFTNNAGTVTVTLPATFAVGAIVALAGQGAGGWTLAANTGQTLQFGNTASTSGGSFSSTNQFDTIFVVGQVANTTWQVLSSVSAGLTKA